MIRDLELTTNALIKFLSIQLIILKKQGVVVHFDGTLMSIINALLVKKTNQFGLKLITPIFSDNKLHTSQLKTLSDKLDLELSFVDLTKERNNFGLHLLKDQTTSQQIAFNKRMIDLILLVESDQLNYHVASNLCYSQWLVNFPHKCYQSKDQIHLLNRFFYSELQQLGDFLGLSKDLLNKEPSFHLWNGQTDRELLNFSYSELETFFRSQKEIKSEADLLISKMLQTDNRNEFCCPPYQRPSTYLS